MAILGAFHRITSLRLPGESPLGIHRPCDVSAMPLNPTPVGIAGYLVALRPDANSYTHCVPVRCTLACDNVALRALSLWSCPDIKWRHGPPATLTASADILCPLATAAQDRWANNVAACPRPLAPGERGRRDVAALDDGDRPIA